MLQDEVFSGTRARGVIEDLQTGYSTQVWALRSRRAVEAEVLLGWERIGPSASLAGICGLPVKARAAIATAKKGND